MLENEAKSRVNHVIMQSFEESINQSTKRTNKTKDRKNLEHRLDSEKIEQK